MQKSTLIPFLRKDLDILFVGLNPAKGSSMNRHYFSVNQAFWNQLFESGLITTRVSKSNADDLIFGSNHYNYKNWNFGITDLVTEIAESNSSKVRPKEEDSVRLENTILRYRPKTVVLLHGKVLKIFLKYLGYKITQSNSGNLGKFIKTGNTSFFNIAFPHGNSIPSEKKILKYVELKEYLKSNYEK